MRDLFNSAEAYLLTWEKMLASSAAINAKGIVTTDGILRPAPSAGPLPVPVSP